MKMHKIIARDIPDLWFQALNDIFDVGSKFKVDCGSYSGQTRLEYDFFTGYIKYPGTIPLIPDINPTLGIPNPVDYNYIFGGDGYERSYIEYLMSNSIQDGEAYTYGERLTKTPINYLKANKKEYDKILINKLDKKIIFEENKKMYINQIEWVIYMYKKLGYRNNQLVLQIAKPSDIILDDPPCLRHIDTRIQDNTLSFFTYFRSWDLWGGLPANLAAIQTLKEYMSKEIGVKDGPIIVESKGLHLYGYAEKLAKIRCFKS